MNKKHPISAKTIPELRVELAEIKKETFALKMQKAKGGLKNPRLLFHKRKEIARLLTAIKEKELKNA
ncbi:MAG: 50S ribosomal protein L29 [bacterium]|nr:50S ribosomal protein L29 [bacterium]